MAFNASDIVDSEVINTNGNMFTVTKYIGKKSKSHEYIITFKDTNNKYTTTREKIKRKTPKDELRVKFEKKQKSKENIKNRKKKYNKEIKPEDSIIVKNKDSTTVLSIDQATRNCGFSVIRNNNIIDYGVIAETGKDTHDRIYNILKKIKVLIEKHNVDIIILEDIFLGHNLRTYEVLAGLKFCIINMAISMNLKYGAIRAVNWKSYHNILSGTSETQKLAGVKLIKDKLKISVSEDTSDSILMGVYAYSELIQENYKW